MVIHTCNPRTWQVEERGLQVPSQPRLHSKAYLKKKKRKGGREGRKEEKKEGRKEGRKVGRKEKDGYDEK
jgi:hypothetical protein